MGDTFEILTAAGGITGMFDTELLPALTGSLYWEIDYGANTVSLTGVPEPSTIVLLILAAAALCCRRRRIAH